MFHSSTRIANPESLFEHSKTRIQGAMALVLEASRLNDDTWDQVKAEPFTKAVGQVFDDRREEILRAGEEFLRTGSNDWDAWSNLLSRIIIAPLTPIHQAALKGTWMEAA